MSSACNTNIQVRQANPNLVECQHVNEDKLKLTQCSFTDILKCCEDGIDTIFAESQ